MQAVIKTSSLTHVCEKRNGSLEVSLSNHEKIIMACFISPEDNISGVEVWKIVILIEKW